VALAGGYALAQAPQPAASTPIRASEHWTTKKTDAGDVRLFLWRKRTADAAKGTIVFVHGSSVSATPVFDLQISGKPEASTMDWFARLGYDTWCVDCEGYGRSDKWRPVNADVSCGADDVAAAAEYIAKNANSSKVFLYGSSSGALRAGLFAQRHPERVQRVALDALVWTGEGSPTLAERRQTPAAVPCEQPQADRPRFRAQHLHARPSRDERPDGRGSIRRRVLALDTSVPTGTYIDMSANLPVLDPERITVPTLILRGQWDGIASFQDLSNFFAKLPNPDKQFIVMPGIAHTSTRSKNWRLVYHLLDSYSASRRPSTSDNEKQKSNRGRPSRAPIRSDF